jgi:hypothetical protein
MFTFNKTNQNTIVGTLNGKPYGVTFDQSILDAMTALESQMEQVTTGAEAKELDAKFEALIQENSKDKVDSGIPSVVKTKEGKYYLTINSIQTSVAIPISFIDRMKLSLDKGLSIDPLIKFWTRFLRNQKLRSLSPISKELFAERVCSYIDQTFCSYDQVSVAMEKHGYTEEVATNLCTVPQVKISKEGFLCTYKVSREITKRYRLNDKGEKESYDVYEPQVVGIDEITGMKLYSDKPELPNESRVFEPAVQSTSGDEFFCDGAKGHIIRVGKVHRLEHWNQVDTNDNVSCRKGLHVGNLDYIKCYQNCGTETHNILVDPAYIGAVTDDGSGALRVKEYFVLDAFSGVNGAIYHSSHYGAITDAAWDEERKIILAEAAKSKEEQDAFLKEFTQSEEI